MTPQEPSGSLPSPSSPQPATPLPWFSCPPPVHGDPFKPGLAIEMAKQNEFYALHAANTLPLVERERDAAFETARKLEALVKIGCATQMKVETERDALLLVAAAAKKLADYLPTHDKDENGWCELCSLRSALASLPPALLEGK